jgi:putative ABC transport system permease protein
MLRQLLNWFRLRRLDNDLERELDYHLGRRVDDLMRSGLSEPEARRQATLETGGIAHIREDVRDVWLTRWLRDFAYDLRFSARSFVRRPSFTVTAVLSFALGIGATTAIYSLVDQVILHALPVREPERLVLIDWNGYPASVMGFGTYNLMSYPICRALHQQERLFEGVLCRAATTISLSTGGDHAPAAAEVVSGTYFPVLGVRPSVGRLFTTDDDQVPGAHPVVVLSFDFWKTQLAGAPDVVGRKVLVNRHPMTVIGVAASGFRGIDIGEVPALWIPAAMSAQAIPGFDQMMSARARWMQVFGRLRPEVTAAEAQAGLQPWFKSLLDEDSRRPDFPKLTPARRQRYFASSLELTPAAQGHSPLRRRMAEPLWFLFGATVVLLAIACMNVAGLFLARGSARGREISTRLALGASSGRIGRQLLADSLLTALAGGALGVVLAPLIMQTLIAFLPHDVAAHALHSVVDARLVVFAFLVSLIAGGLSGCAPALQARSASLIAPLNERAGTAFGSLRLRRTIVTAQIAITLILVVGAALFVRTLTALLAKGPGFETSSLISFGVDPVRNGYSPAQAERLVRRIHQDIRSLRSVASAAIVYNPLLTGGSWNQQMTIQGDQRITSDREVRLNSISPEFFRTLGARIVAGRDFVERDALPASEGGQCVAIVNDAFAKRYFNGRSPLGARIGLGNGPDVKPAVEVVGVVTDISYRGVREEWEQAWFPIVSCGNTGSTFYVRIRGARDTAIESIRAIVRNADPTLAIGSFRTLDEQVRRSLTTERMLAVLSVGFGALALLLSLVGLYGVISFTVTQRTREIGLRVALGASRLSTVWLVLRDALVMTMVGVGVALPSIWALGRVIESQLYDVRPTDPATMAAGSVILCCTALGAALIPARRASALNPTDALRLE